MSVEKRIDEEYIKNLRDNVDALRDIDDASKELIRRALSGKDPPRMTPEQILHIWDIGDGRQLNHLPDVTTTILWIEQGNDKAGMTHILSHKEDFESIGVPQDKLIELAQATTTVGAPSGHFQGKPRKNLPQRPILLLYFHGNPVAVAISVGSNGFVVGMNPGSFNDMIQKTGLDQEWIKKVATWPKV